jgi:hypothetical protein
MCTEAQGSESHGWRSERSVGLSGDGNIWAERSGLIRL